MTRHHWRDYRLGDMVRCYRLRQREDGEQLHLREYPRSVASSYMRLVPPGTIDINVLARIVWGRYTRAAQAAPTRSRRWRESSWAVHVRAGDVIEKSPYSVDEHLSAPGAGLSTLSSKGIIYVRPISHFARRFDPKGPVDVTIVCGGCKADTFEKSEEYARKLAEWFASHSLVREVRIRLARNPDEDFVLMCTAANYIPSGGGFSEIVSMTRSRLRAASIQMSKYGCPLFR